jgi:hypothetical protein
MSIALIGIYGDVISNTITVKWTVDGVKDSKIYMADKIPDAKVVIDAIKESATPKIDINAKIEEIKLAAAKDGEIDCSSIDMSDVIVYKGEDTQAVKPN